MTRALGTSKEVNDSVMGLGMHIIGSVELHPESHWGVTAWTGEIFSHCRLRRNKPNLLLLIRFT